MIDKKLIKSHVKNHWETSKHKLWVAYFIFKLTGKLLHRAFVHDLSKYRWAEAEGFAKSLYILGDTEYGTPAYNELRKSVDVGPSIAAHYKHKANTHHPENHINGYQDMTALDRIEMICDWLAAVKRTKDGSIDKSLIINKDRFNISDEDEQWLESIVKEVR